jgi:hypothetical protein
MSKRKQRISRSDDMLFSALGGLILGTAGAAAAGAAGTAAVGALAASAIAGAGTAIAGGVQGAQANRQQEDAMRQQKKAQEQAMRQATEQQMTSEQTIARANRKSPDIGSIYAEAANRAGPSSSTMLTGPTGVLGGMPLGRSTLLGG